MLEVTLFCRCFVFNGTFVLDTLFQQLMNLSLNRATLLFLIAASSSNFGYGEPESRLPLITLLRFFLRQEKNSMNILNRKLDALAVFFFLLLRTCVFTLSVIALRSVSYTSQCESNMERVSLKTHLGSVWDCSALRFSALLYVF